MTILHENGINEFLTSDASEFIRERNHKDNPHFYPAGIPQLNPTGYMLRPNAMYKGEVIEAKTVALLSLADMPPINSDWFLFSVEKHEGQYQYRVRYAVPTVQAPKIRRNTSMATLIREYVSKLTDEEIVGIIESWEEFEVAGMIGDKPIRTHTEKMMADIDYSNVTIWMQMLAFECSLVFAKRYIEKLNS